MKIKALFKWLFRYKVTVSRVDVLKLALKMYESGFYVGLCWAIYAALDKYDLTPKNSLVNWGKIHKIYIPRFTPPRGKDYGEYWWDMRDRKSRIDFMNELIEFYKDDKTNLYDIKDKLKQL